MQHLTKNLYPKGYQLETNNRSIQYFDIFLAYYDPTIIKAERTITCKKTDKTSHWKAWFRLPKDLMILLKVKNSLFDFLSESSENTQQFENWLEQRLLDETQWMLED